MSHEVETMAYANQVPWHGLGTQVSDTMSPNEMLVAAGLDWTVSKRAAYTIDNPNTMCLTDPTSESNFIHVPDNHFVMRDTDNTVLSHCGPNYVPFQNAEVMDFFSKFTDAGNMKMETAGSLKNGQEIWGLAKLDSNFAIGDDRVGGYLLLNNSHKAGKAMSIMFTPIRVVCNNTLTLAMNTANSKDRFRVCHVQMFDEEIKVAAEQALGLSGEAMTSFKEQAEFLSSKRIKEHTLEQFIAELCQPQLLVDRKSHLEKLGEDFTLPPLRDQFNRKATQIREAFENSPGAWMPSANGTWWGALNAVTYVVDHQGSSNQEGALNSAWFGSGAQVKRKAMAKALEYAEAA